MKTKHNRFLHLTWILLVASLIGLQAQNNPAGKGLGESTNFAGSNLKMQDIVSRCDCIFIGQTLQIGAAAVSAPGGAEFCGNQVKVLQTLQGTIATQVSVSFIIAEGPQEQVPAVGNSYIFFVNKVAHPDPDQYMAIKILPATDDNIAKVKALIAAAPTGK